MKCIAHILVSIFFATQLHGDMLIIAHRGASGHEPENTLPSFQKAVDMGVDMIELDVYVCATGELMVMHDNFVNRTTNGHGKVQNMSLQDIKRLTINGTLQVPTLEEVIDLVNRKVPIDIELKGAKTAKPVVNCIRKYLQNGWQYDDFVVSSFDHQQVKQFKKKYPKITAGVLFDKNHKIFTKESCSSSKKPSKIPARLIKIARKHNANFIGFDAAMANQELVQQLQDAGFPVYVWTVNDKEIADKMRDCGVAGIFTNFPDKV